MIPEKSVIILGGGGHASVVADTLRALNYIVLGFVAPNSMQMKNFPDINYLGDDGELLNRYPAEAVWLANGIGSVSPEKNKIRQTIYTSFKEKGYTFATLIHPSAAIASTALLCEGVQIMAGVVIQSNAVIHENVIINTKASVDHDCEIGHSVHIAPGVVMSGNVKVKENAFIGVGTSIIQGITIGQDAMVRAGRVVVKDIPSEMKDKE